MIYYNYVRFCHNIDSINTEVPNISTIYSTAAYFNELCYFPITSRNAKVDNVMNKYLISIGQCHHRSPKPVCRVPPLCLIHFTVIIMVVKYVLDT